MKPNQVQTECAQCHTAFSAKASARRKFCSITCNLKHRTGRQVKRYRYSWGYRYINTPGHPFANDGLYVAEHRLVMERHLGRYLKPHEIVHHINENKLDNRIENLELKNHTTHAADHIKERHRDKLGRVVSSRNIINEAA